jgi:hypothetical protein
MRRGTPPVNPLLDLWSLGHCARDIAERLGIEGGHRMVTLVVGEARSIGDKRAVLHKDATGRLIGRPGRMMPPPLANVVPALPHSQQRTHCPRGHERTPDNLTKGGSCRTCNITRLRWRRDIIKAASR